MVSQTNEQMTESSGFYCCEVLDSERNDETVLTVCATIVVEGKCSYHTHNYVGVYGFMSTHPSRLNMGTLKSVHV